MKCLNREEIQLYIDREMPEEELQSVTSHLSECADCRILYEQAQQDIDLLDGIFASRDIIINQKEIPAFIYPKRNSFVLMKLAVACVTVGVVVLFSISYWQSEKSKNSSIINTASSAAPLNEFPVEDLDPNQQFQEGKMNLEMIYQ